MANYGIKVALAGYDTATATDQQLAFSSEFNTLKISTSGSGNVDCNGVATTVQIAHGLGYVPAFLVLTEIFLGVDGVFYLVPYTYPAGGDASIIAYADSTNLNIRYGANFQGPSAGDSADYKYVIYLNEGSD